MGLNTLIQRIKDRFKSKPVDTSVFDDPFASQISWEPKNNGGANFKTRTLVEDTPTRLIYQGSLGSKIFGALFIIFPILIFYFQFNGDNASGSGVIPFIILTIFPTAGILILYVGSRPLVIDTELGYLYKSYKKPVTTRRSNPSQNWVSLDTVRAIQVLKESVRSDDSSYTSYKINLVFEDGSRYNVVDHAHLSSITSDAQLIAELLKVPIWNIVDGSVYSPKSRLKQAQGSYDSTLQEKSNPERKTRDTLDEDYDSLKPREL